MKRSILFFITLLLLSFSVSAQYESTNKPVTIDYKKLDLQVGKKYWIKANPEAIFRHKFGENLNLIYYDSFVVTSDLEFIVIGWELGNSKTPHLKLQFEDGKIAYIEVLLWKINKDVLDDVFDGSEYRDYKEYFFKGKPSDVLANWRKRNAQAEVEHKAKGGVRIGFSKEDVLKSNWGKPESVNKTTTANGVREQWVYSGGNYLYFINGILTSIQN